MDVEIVTTMQLYRAQTIAGFILSILGIGWFIFLSNIVKINAFHRIKYDGGLPIFESIVPTNLFEVFKLLRTIMTGPVILICTMVMIGLLLTVFDSLIIPNTISFNESCKLADVMTQAQILNDRGGTTLWAYFKVEEMRQRRNKSGVPHDIIVGQIPEDPRWKFNPQFDVDPYPWRSSCSLYNSGTTQVRMNTSILTGDTVDVLGSLPEIHKEFVFGNSPEGYENKELYYHPFTFSNNSNNVLGYNGALILMKEAFIYGNISEIGGKFLDRMWTLRVPETTRIPFDKSIIVPVPIIVKAYSCEMKRVKKGNRGSFNLLLGNKSSAILETLGSLIADKWFRAMIKGDDTSLYELTPDYWTSYISVHGSKVPKVEMVPAQINMPCIKIQPIYILLVCFYVLMILIGCICWCVVQKNHCEIPSTSVEWANLAYKESITDENSSKVAAKKAKLGIISDDIKILSNKETYPLL